MIDELIDRCDRFGNAVGSPHPFGRRRRSTGVMTLVLIGLVAGIVTALSPCVLPILPVVLVASVVPAGASVASPGAPPGAAGDGAMAVERTRAERLRPLVVISGLLVSFSVFTLVGSALLTLIGLPLDLLRWIGVLILAAAGVGLLVPAIGEWIERPFARIPMRKLNRNGSGFVLGMGLGLVFVPCAGPVLAAITVLGASGKIGWPLVALTVSFAVGVAIPLTIFAMAGQRVGERVRGFRSHAALMRKVAGGVLLAMAVLIGFNATAFVQRLVPGYVDALAQQVENSSQAQGALDNLYGHDSTPAAAPGARSFDQCAQDPTVLHDCGPGRALTGVSQWLNTPDGKPLSLASLRGKVVHVDFWTYSCINCQRTLPHLEALDQTYRDKGLVVIGVHTPEFAFEHSATNVAQNAASLGVAYPIAIDNDYSTWNAYDNRFWPAHYLIDANGQVRQVHYGEGNYAETESLVRQLLQQAQSSGLPAAAQQPADATVTAGATPETYLGYDRLERSANHSIHPDAVTDYPAPDNVAPNQVGFSGNWLVAAGSAQAGKGAQLLLNFHARDVYLVLGGTGTVGVDVGGHPRPAVQVTGSPKLYTILKSADPASGLLRLTVPEGIQAYAFTFG